VPQRRRVARAVHSIVQTKEARVNILIVGDHFIRSEAFQQAIERELGADAGQIRTVAWAGVDMEAQHAAQQVMEKEGPEAVPTPGEIVDAAGDAEVIAAHFAPISKAVLEAAPRLRAVVVARAGYENVNVEEASRRGVAVVNVLGRNAAAVAEQTLALLLGELRDVARADAAIKAGGWPEHATSPVYELSGKTIGLVGFGHVGRQVARRLAGFGVRLLVYDPYVDPDTIDAHGGIKVLELDAVFRESDVVSLHARLTDETRRFIGAEQFALMKPTAYFINTARSRMVDDDALRNVLTERRIAGAGLDVHGDEPLPPDSPWLQLPNVTLSPHVAGSTEDAWRKSVDLVATAIRELADSGRATNTVNAQALEGGS
jgi:D-3-phosphoglycerate dehydrogenase / 2-oxoglutarate reductase